MYLSILFFIVLLDWFSVRYFQNTFLSFNRTTQAYLLKISIRHNKNLNALLNFFINCISAKSAPQILSLKAEYTFVFFNFLIMRYEVLQLIVHFVAYI